MLMGFIQLLIQFQRQHWDAATVAFNEILEGERDDFVYTVFVTPNTVS